MSMDTYKKRRNLYDQALPDSDIALAIRGFSRQQIITLDEVTRAIDTLPRQHLGGIREIRYQDNHEYYAPNGEYLLSTPPSTKGVFVPEQRAILIHSCTDSDEFLHILYHEIGHYVFHTVLNGAQRKTWVTELHPDTKTVTRYAKTNAGEDFAESYAHFVLDPKQLEKLYRKYRFMRDEVFRGVAVNVGKGHLDMHI